MSYRKSDVQTHYESGARRPAVNIKCHLWESGERGSFPSDLLARAAESAGHEPAPFVAWWRNLAETNEPQFERMLEAFAGFAAESAFETARSDAEDIFPSAVDIWQEGRSGGWLVVEGLPALEEWDAVALSKWRKFERFVRSSVDFHAEMVAELVALNAYEAHLDRIAAAEHFDRIGRWEAAFARSPFAGYAEAFNQTEASAA